MATTPYLGEIRIFAGDYAPSGWALCDGRLLPIAENDPLFNLIGTTYGGDGATTFGLPDLRGRLPVNTGRGPDGRSYLLGGQGGAETVTLTAAQLPRHRHRLVADGDAANEVSPEGAVLARSNLVDAYIERPPDLDMAHAAIRPTGGTRPHDNLMPFQCVSFIIALFGVYPTEN